MSSQTSPLKLREILIFLKSKKFPSRKVEALGRELRIPDYIVETKLANNNILTDFDNALADLINYWLRNETEQSWKKIADALIVCGFTAASENISEETPLILKEVLDFLRKIEFPSSTLKALGRHLNIPEYKIVDIVAKRRSNGDYEDALADVIQHWLNDDPQKSWKKLEDAVTNCEMMPKTSDVKTGAHNQAGLQQGNVKKKGGNFLSVGAVGTDPSIQPDSSSANGASPPDKGQEEATSTDESEDELPIDASAGSNEICTSDQKFPAIKTLLSTNPEYFKKFGPNLAEVHGKGITGSGIKIAIIDAFDSTYPKIGTMKDHMALKNPRLKIKNMTGKKDQCTPTDHALMCTAIAVGQTFQNGHHNKLSCSYPGGIAPEADPTLFLVNFNDIHHKSLSKALKEVEKGNYDVVSMSFGGKAEWMKNSIKAIQKKGTIMIAAAGNGGDWTGVIEPASFEDVISVGSLNTYYKISAFSPEGENVQFFFPGEIMVPTSDSTGTKLSFSTGTSMATPGIAGLICLLLQCAKKHKYDFKRDDIMKLLRKMLSTGGGKKFDEPIAKFLKTAYDEVHFMKNMIDWS